MFEFINSTTEKEYENFASGHKNSNFLQAGFWTSVKKQWDNCKIISRDSNGKVRASIQILIRKVPFLPYTIFYAPRGPICDSNEIEGMLDLIEGSKQLAKKRKGIILITDPAFMADDKEFINNAKGAGFEIIPSKDGFDGIQKRFAFRLNIENRTSEEVFQAFHSKTRYNIRLATRKGVTSRLGTRDDLTKFHEIMKVTGERDEFGIRPLWYFQHMYDTIPEENMRLYVAEYQGNIIAGTIAIYYGDKVWYLYGASSNQHRNVMPNYLLQWNMILWAFEKKCRIYDFRGVSGNVTPDDPQYGLYRFKKGFNGDFVEFMGEMQIVYKPFLNKIIKLVEKIIKKIRR